MIKCNVSVCGTVSKAAVVRNGKDGMPFTTYSVDVVVPAKKGINKTVMVSCIMDGDCAEAIVVGNRIDVKGVLTFKKKDDNLYFNLKGIEVASLLQKTRMASWEIWTSRAKSVRILI